MQVYWYSGIPVISTVTPTSDGTCVELSATRSKVPHHAYTWWGPPPKSVGATSRILTPPGVGWWGCLWCSCYRIVIDQIQYSCYLVYPLYHAHAGVRHMVWTKCHM